MSKLSENKVKETLSTHLAEIAEELDLEGVIMITVSHSEETEDPDLFNRDLELYSSVSISNEFLGSLLENLVATYKEKNEINQ